MVNHIDDSRERPERGVSDTIREKGGFTDDPMKRGNLKAMEDTAARYIATEEQNSQRSDDDDARGEHVQRRREERRNRRTNNRRKKNHEKNRNERNSNTLKTAIERSEDAADAER